MDLVHNDYVYIKIRRGMYGLPQARIIANQLLTSRLAPHGYYQCRHTSVMWKHQWRPILFFLVVDNFGIKYVGKKHADHLISAIKGNYDFAKDWARKLYCGISIKWYYARGVVDLSMPNYIHLALHKFQHPAPTHAQHAPHAWTRPIYGTQQQYTRSPDKTQLLQTDVIKRVHKITVTLLYYAKFVNYTLLVALGTISYQQAKANAATNQFVVQLLDYCATHPDAVLCY